MMILWNCTCGYVRRVEYFEHGRRFVDPEKGALGGTIHYNEDRRCPHCYAIATAGRVRGTVTDHVCDARCTQATGPVCNCSCGGKNHGIAYAA